MKSLVYVVALTALAAAAYAACEFPYYPEYTELVEPFDKVTPAMAKAALPREESQIAAEPLLLHDVNGMPFCYMSAVFGADAALAEWDETIRKLNAGEKVPAAALEARVEAFYEGAYGEPVAVYLQPTYTFEWDVAEVGSGVFPAFVSYGAAYETAVTELGEDLSFAGIIAADVGTTQVFAFENAAGESAEITANEYGFTRTATAEDLLYVGEELIEGRFDIITEEPELAQENHASWEALRAGLE
jgi:hypothetical protein